METVEPAPVSVATKSLEREEDAATSKEVAAAMEQQSAQPFITVNADATDMNEVLQRGSSLDVVYNDDLAACKSPTKKVAHSK